MNQLPRFINHFVFPSFFLWENLHLISIFVPYSVIHLKYSQWNYFLNNFSLFDGMLTHSLFADGT